MNLRFIFALVLCLTTSAAVAVVNSHDPTGNTSAPTGANGQPTDPGWANVGAVANAASGGGSGVYLGNGWVLTAKHVGAGTFTTSGGSSYSYDGTNSISIAGADLMLFKLNTIPPDLAALTLCPTTPGNGSEVVMIGNGVSATSSSPTKYYVDTTLVNDDGDRDWAWSTSPFAGANATINGYTTSGTRTIRWGTNTIAGNSFLDGVGHVYYTAFNLTGGTTYEAQAVMRDSGGAVFYHDGTSWYLSGIMARVGTHSNQPGGANSAFDGNLTYIVDLSQYADQINPIIPEPATYAAIFALVVAAAVMLRRRKR